MTRALSGGQSAHVRFTADISVLRPDTASVFHPTVDCVRNDDYLVVTGTPCLERLPLTVFTQLAVRWRHVRVHRQHCDKPCISKWKCTLKLSGRFCTIVTFVVKTENMRSCGTVCNTQSRWLSWTRCKSFSWSRLIHSLHHMAYWVTLAMLRRLISCRIIYSRRYCDHRGLSVQGYLKSYWEIWTKSCRRVWTNEEWLNFGLIEEPSKTRFILVINFSD